MIVDIHTHFLTFETDCTDQVRADLRRCNVDPLTWQFTSEDHLRETEAADYAVVFGLQATCTGWCAPNDAVVQHAARAPHRLIFFAAIDPGQEGFMAELERCHQDLHCKGVKIGPIYQGVHPLDARYYRIYEYCQRHELPIMAHMATTFSSGVPLDYARPVHMDQVACDFPDLKLVLAHLGHPWEAETLASIRKQPNVYADVSALYYRPWQFYNAMRLALEYRAESNLLFGSDYPATTTVTSIQGLHTMNDILGQSGLPPVPLDVIDDIIHRDSLELLGIPKPKESQS